MRPARPRKLAMNTFLTRTRHLGPEAGGASAPEGFQLPLSSAKQCQGRTGHPHRDCHRLPRPSPCHAVLRRLDPASVPSPWSGQASFMAELEPAPHAPCGYGEALTPARSGSWSFLAWGTGPICLPRGRRVPLSDRQPN